MIHFHFRFRGAAGFVFFRRLGLAATSLALVIIAGTAVTPETALAQALCPFNVSGATSPRLTVDGTLLSRYAQNVRGNPLTKGVMPAVTTSQSSAIETAILGNAYTRLDVDGDGLYTATDALIIARYLAGYTSDKWLTGLTVRAGALRPLHADIALFIAQGCPAPVVSLQNEAARL